MVTPPRPVELRTARLTLRPFRADDVDDSLAYRDDPEFARFLPEIPQPFTRRDAEAFVAVNMTDPWDTMPTFAVVLDGRVIGTVNVELDLAARSAMLGYAIGRAYWGRGLTTEAAAAVLRWLVATHGATVDELWASVDAANVRSRRVLDKLGLIVDPTRSAPGGEVRYAMRLARALRSPDDALGLLATLGATPWLVRHHQLVVEAAELLCTALARDTAARFDRTAVLLGAALHDAGKIHHPEEMQRAGDRHEAAGRQLLLDAGVDASIARFCVTHAAWSADVALEDLLVALADKLWKGKRVDDLEDLVVQQIAALTQAEPWAVFDRVDHVFAAIAAGGPDRLARSAVADASR
jgi:ribosomal-protein-alanine N-acetyltransferase